MTSFQDFATICQRIEDTSSSLDMTQMVAEFFQKVDDDELEIVARFIMGLVFPVWSPLQMGIGPSLLYTAVSKASGLPVKEVIDLVRKTGDVGLAARDALTTAKKAQSTFAAFNQDKPGLSLQDVYSRLTDIANSSGKGSQAARVRHLQFLFSVVTPAEAIYLARLAIEELRIGVGEGIVRDAIAAAFNVPKEAVERAYMMTNDLGLVAREAKLSGTDGVTGLDIKLGRPIKMMLAQVSQGITAVAGEMGTVAVEWKFDGARVQIHKNGDNVSLFSRRLEDVTASLPDIVDMVRTGVNARSAVLDGEAVVLGQDGKPGAFQQILKRFRRKYDVDNMKGEIPLQLFLFDLVYLNGESLFDRTLVQRRERLVECVISSGTMSVAEQIVTSDINTIEGIYKQALDAGHEGVMLKNPESLYSPGKRGKHWLKVKPLMETLDLAVVGGEWGEGRRANFIGSYHLACIESDTGEFLSIGRVGTGITDEMLDELTSRFKELIVVESGKELEFVPQVVFEVAFEEIQKSPTYDSGFALRFPRLVRVRDDKSADEADTLERIEQLNLNQKGRGYHTA
ncbi:MAG: ATP-dependent DNA ligase [Methanosarcinales archaeon]|nr:ATP-dependent DNA ligase [ANME-2 cluster archaeon]MDW7775375.1 ATP-dependent DNA ligase [Methanosarcinales archaeon]